MRVVILGAGFGGVYVARGIHRCLGRQHQLTVVNRENYFLFTPLLHEVATGSLAPHTIVEPLRSVLDEHVQVRVADVRRVRLADRVVETSRGDIAYDRLVVALGAEANFYGTPGAAEHGLDVKTMGDAIRLKRRCIDAFEAAAATEDRAEREALLRFVVVGGGPTGVEVVAELAEFVSGSLLPMYRAALGGVEPRIVLLQAAAELLPQFTPVTRTRALAALRRRGIEVRLQAAVASVDADGAVLASGERVAGRLVVWVAGVKPTTLAFDAEVERDRAGRIVVDTTLHMKGRDDVYVIGDIACSVPSGGTAPLPPFAQVAVRQAEYVSRALSGELLGDKPSGRAFTYRNQGNLVSLGQWEAAAEIGPFRFWGRFAWWMWRTIYLTKFLSHRKRFTIALQWTINLVSPRDATRLSTWDESQARAGAEARK